MTHADDDGMIMPPRIAPQQVVIIPIVRDDSDAPALIDYCRQVATKLKTKGVRVQVDESEERTPTKMWSTIKKGVPVRIEIGGREMEQGMLTYIRRDLGKDSKQTVIVDEFVNGAESILNEMHKALFERAKKMRDENITDLNSLDELHEFYKKSGFGFARLDAALIDDPAYEKIKGDLSLTSRCLPMSDGGKKIIVGKAY